MKKKITNWLPKKWQRTTKALGISLALVGLSNVSSGQCNWPASGITLYGTGTANNISCASVTTGTNVCHFFNEYATFNSLIVGQSYTITVTNTDASSPAGPYTLGVYSSATAGTAPLASTTNATFPISVTFVATSTSVSTKSFTGSCGNTGSNCNYYTILNNGAPAAAPATNQPSVATVASGSSNVQVLRLDVSACATSTLSDITFGTTGSTNPATDISTAKVYYTTSTTFSSTTQFGTAVANPNGTFTVSGSQTIPAGVGYFWLVYDLACGAVATNVLDAEVTAYTLAGTSVAVTGTTSNPTGTRAITATAAAATRSDANGTTAVSAGSVNAPFVYANVNACGVVSQVDFSVIGTSTNTDISQAKCYYSTSSTFNAATATPFGTPVANPVAGTVSFSGSQSILTGNNYFWMVYDVACNAVGGNTLNGNITNLVVNGAAITPTGTTPAANSITAIGIATRTDGNGTTAVTVGSINAPFVYGNISGSANCPTTVSQVDFAVTANAGDVSQAKCFYSTTSTFSTATPFGAPVLNPVTGVISFAGTQALAAGSNYFWMVYDVNCTATTGNTINGDIISITANGSPVIPTGTATAANTITASTVINTVADGDWSSPATWSCGSIPTSSTPVAINHNVTVSSTGNVSGNITIASGKSLTIASGDLTMGPIGGGNRTFTNNGTLTVNGGVLNLNGNMLHATGSKFNQTAGDVNVDGNAAGVAANSVASGTFIVHWTIAVAADLNLTGGNFIIVDPHIATTYTFQVTYSPTGSVSAGLGHTFKMGDGISTDAGGTNGFMFYSWNGSGIFKFGNLEINGSASGANRFFTNVTGGFGPVVVIGNLTVNNFGEYRQQSSTDLKSSTFVNGNLNVNAGGIMTTQNNVYFGNVTSASATTLTYSPSTNAQTVSGAGIFRNLISAPTANFTSITVNNTNPSGVTFADANTLLSGSNTGTISGTLTLTAGTVNTGANTLVLGTSPTSAGTYTYTSGMIMGKFKRFITAATGSRAFNIGTATGAKTATINFTAAPTTAGSLTAEWVSAPSGNSGLPIVEGVNEFTQASSLGYWTVSAGNGLAGGTYTATFNGVGLADVSDYNSLTVGKRSDASAPWALDGTYVAPTGSNANFVISRTGIASGFSDFGILGGATALPVKLANFTGKNAGTINTLNWKTTEEKNFSHFELQRSKDGANFHKLAVVSSNRNDMGSDYAYNDERPFEGKNFYRLNMVDVDGRSVTSEVVELMVKAGTSLSVNVYPNPVSQQLNIEVAGKIDGNAKVIISDMVGKAVRTIALTGNTAVVDMNNLPSGIYMIKYSDNSQSSVIKVTKD